MEVFIVITFIFYSMIVLSSLNDMKKKIDEIIKKLNN